jgi:amidase
MDRRTFLRSSSIAGLTLAVSSCKSSKNNVPESLNEHTKPDAFELNEATMGELQDWMDSGKYTSRDITQLYLDRITKIDKSGPRLNAVIEINPDALAMADAMDEERRSDKVRGSIHGIPILIKDNIDTGDKMQTTAGSLALEGNIAERDSFVIQKLRVAGAVLLGKTNLSEWANFRSEKSTSGWSSRGGQTKNPYVLDRNPLGSSAGSGVSVAANLCAAAVGTETDGSIVCPASVNGIVGIKPTVGLISRSGIIPLSTTQDTAGPMTRTVRDAAILLGVMEGVDPRDSATARSESIAHTDYTKFLDPESLRGKRFGIDKNRKSSLTKANTLLEQAIALMKARGAAFIEMDYSKQINELGKDEMTVLEYEFKQGLDRYLSLSCSKMRTLKDIIAFNDKHAAQVMPYFGQDILISSEAKGSLSNREYKEARARNLSVSRDLIRKMLRENKLDAICGLTMGPPPCTDLLYGDRFGDIYAATAPAIAGFPHITVPCGEVFGLPVGISFFADAYSEPELISIAFAYEQTSKKRTCPEFIPALES